MATKTMWLTKQKFGGGESYYDLWRNKPRKVGMGFMRLGGEAPVYFCARLFEKYCPELKMRVGEICQVEVKIKRKTKPEKAKAR